MKRKKASSFPRVSCAWRSPDREGAYIGLRCPRGTLPAARTLSILPQLLHFRAISIETTTPALPFYFKGTQKRARRISDIKDLYLSHLRAPLSMWLRGTAQPHCCCVFVAVRMGAFVFHLVHVPPQGFRMKSVKWQQDHLVLGNISDLWSQAHRVFRGTQLSHFPRPRTPVWLGAHTGVAHPATATPALQTKICWNPRPRSHKTSAPCCQEALGVLHRSRQGWSEFEVSLVISQGPKSPMPLGTEEPGCPCYAGLEPVFIMPAWHLGACLLRKAGLQSLDFPDW